MIVRLPSTFLPSQLLSSCNTFTVSRKASMPTKSAARLRASLPSSRTSSPPPPPTPPRTLFSLSPLIPAIFLRRPSARNKSPFVADIHISSLQRDAIAHMPSLDMGGKCVAGARLLVRHARDAKGQIVPRTATSPKYGTPKCEFIAHLLWVDERALLPAYAPVWVGAHPALGERIAEVWLRESLLDMRGVIAVRAQVRDPCGAEGIRADFEVEHEDGGKRIVEVKTVVDTDYAVGSVPELKGKTKFVVSNAERYSRTAVFPWGDGKQKGPEGEAVVSARAIHHVRQLTRIASGELRGDGGEKYEATVLLVVVRRDAAAFAPNYMACPSFSRYLKEAADAGVGVIARSVIWGEGEQEGVCFDGANLPIVWPGQESK